MVLTRAYPNFRLDIRPSVPLLDYVAKFGMLISVWVLVHAGAPEREAPLFFPMCAKNIRLTEATRACRCMQVRQCVDAGASVCRR